nr:oxidoreductase [Cryptomonas curvata]|mmetsp:Transcript_40435/g.84479  ORF Transcript_40435/g.84479 Transcript_40435/m.84479 type:complete len:182 (-) Transcript_40435:4042-4587(-)
MLLINPDLNCLKLKFHVNSKHLVLFCKKNNKMRLNKHKKSLLMNDVTKESKDTSEKIFNEKEKTFFEGPPSKSELIIPFISILTVIGIIPFISTLFRQFWVSYKITNRRISVKSGFQGNNKVEIVYRDIKKVSYITRFGGITADLVILLKDNARLEIRSLPDWEKNIEYIKSNCPDTVDWN